MLAGAILACYPAANSAVIEFTDLENLATQTGGSINSDGDTLKWADGTDTNIYDFLPNISGSAITLDVGANDVVLGGPSEKQFGSANMTITKTGEGMLTITQRTPTAVNLVIDEGIVRLDRDNAWGTLIGKAQVNAGTELQLWNGQANGWSRGGGLSEIMLDGGILRTGNDEGNTTGGNLMYTTVIMKNGGQFIGDNSVKMAAGTKFIVTDNTETTISSSNDSELLLTKDNVNMENPNEQAPTFQVDGGSTLTITARLGGAGMLVKTGEGKLVLTGNKSYSGGTIINGGELEVIGGGDFGVIRGLITVNDGGQLTLNGGDVLGFQDSYACGTFWINQGGIVNFATANNQTFQTRTITLNGGSLTGVSGSSLDLWDSSIHATADSTISEIQLKLRGDNGKNDNKIIVDEGAVLTISSQIVDSSNATALVKTGKGTLLLTNSGNSYSQETIVQEGVLQLHRESSGSTAMVRGDITVHSGAKLEALLGDVFGWSATPGNLNLLEDGILEFSNTTGSITVGSDRVDDYGMVINMKSGSRITGAGEANLFNTKIVVENTRGDAAVIDTANLKVRPNNRDVVFSVQGLDGALENAPDLIVQTSLANYGDQVFTKEMVKEGDGVMALTGTNTYGAATHVKEGTLMVGNGGATGTLGTNNVIVDQNARLVVNRSNEYTLTNTVSGGGSLSHIGTGTTTLGNANTYTGGTILSHGKLVAAHADALGTGDVTISGGILNVSVPTLNIGGNVSMTGGSIIFDPREPASGLGRAQGTARMNLMGDFVLGGTASVQLDMYAANDYDYIKCMGSGTFTLADTASLVINVLWEINDTSTFNIDEFFVDFNSLNIDYNLVSITGYDASTWSASIANDGTVSFADISNIPEPSSAALIGLAALGLTLRRRKSAS